MRSLSLVPFLIPLLIGCDSADDTEQPRDSSAAAIDSIPEPASDTGTRDEEPPDYSFRKETIFKSDKNLKYEATVEIPQLEWLEDEEIAEHFNGRIREWAEDQIAEFVEGVIPPDSTLDSTQQLSGLTVNYKVHLANARGFSIEFESVAYNAGAAHPNSLYSTINYDVRTGEIVALHDLFNTGEEYLEIIADYCVNELRKREWYDAESVEWLENGTKENLENYDGWYVTNDGLGIVFDPYQVAPYAAGEQRVIIPWSVLDDMIDPESIVGTYVS